MRVPMQRSGAGGRVAPVRLLASEDGAELVPETKAAHGEGRVVVRLRAEARFLGQHYQLAAEPSWPRLFQR